MEMDRMKGTLFYISVTALTNNWLSFDCCTQLSSWLNDQTI